MKTPMLLLFVLSAFALAAQSPEIKSVKANDTTTAHIEVMPIFPGGDDSLLVFLKRNVKYPELASDSGTQGTVFVTFVVNEDGSISGVKLLKGIVGRAGGHECNEEAMRVVREMPNWIPGEQEGKSVKVQYNLPITFTFK
jgi:periplasmic protein TonB